MEQTNDVNELSLPPLPPKPPPDRETWVNMGNPPEPSDDPELYVRFGTRDTVIERFVLGFIIITILLGIGLLFAGQ
jgi:hypothetical protein